MIMHLLLSILACYVFIGNAYKLEIKIGELKQKKTAKQYLYDYGYFPDMCSSDTCGMSKKDEVAMIKNFQDFANLKQTGTIDDATVKQMGIARCGKSDQKFAAFKDTRGRRYRRYNPQGSTWKKVLEEGKPVTWRYAKPNSEDGITEDLPKSEVRRILMKAMSLWSMHGNINFEEDNINVPDIWIYFQGGRHGDPFPFDGTGGTLAHAFYPLNNKGLSGDMHLDDAETFTEGTPEGRNLLWVATHELGHSIGLAHSNVRQSVMYPWYTGYQGDFNLREDDIRGIQTVYGKKKLVPTPPTALPPTTPLQPCYTEGITAIWRIPGRGYGISTASNVNYLFQGDKREPLQLTKSGIDAAFTTKLGDNTKESTIFFSGEHYSVFTEDFVYVSGPHSIHEKRENGKSNPLQIDFPSDVKNIQAAVKWQRNGKLYLFYRYNGVGYYRRYNFQMKSFDRVRRRIHWRTKGKWGGLPKEGPDAAISTNNLGNWSYFIAGDKIYKFNNRRVQVDTGYPKQVGADDFFNCINPNEPIKAQ